MPDAASALKGRSARVGHVDTCIAKLISELPANFAYRECEFGPAVVKLVAESTYQPLVAGLRGKIPWGRLIARRLDGSASLSLYLA